MFIDPERDINLWVFNHSYLGVTTPQWQCRLQTQKISLEYMDVEGVKKLNKNKKLVKKLARTRSSMFFYPQKLLSSRFPVFLDLVLTRDAFSGFDPKIVANLNERQITSTSTEYGIKLSRFWGAVGNS